MGDSIFSRVLKFLFNKSEKLEEAKEENFIEQVTNKNSYVNSEIDSDDKLVVALAASIMAGKDKPNSHFHISKITRIDNTYENAYFNRDSYEIEEEEKLVVALAASILAGKDKPNSHFHISKITKVS